MPDYLTPTRSHGLVEILDRVLDKGLVIAGDIKINLANVELLTIQVRLLVCSIDKAQEIGLNWWRYDSRLTAPTAPGALPQGELEQRLDRIERRLNDMAASRPVPRGRTTPSSTSEHERHGG
ncbi:MAG TPA: gas vesicle protein [Gemmatimonadaceae bacterium]